MARPKDAPHRTLFVVVPYFATLIGGLQRRIINDTTSMIPHVVVSAPERVPLAAWERRVLALDLGDPAADFLGG
jgi:hexokinase